MELYERLLGFELDIKLIIRISSESDYDTYMIILITNDTDGYRFFPQPGRENGHER